jgi:hypothetical protein
VKLFAVAAALATTTACQAQIPAPAAPWDVIFEGGQALVSVDTARLSVRAGVADVWLRFDYDAPDTSEGVTFQRVDTHHRITCAAQRVEDLSMELRDADGRKVDEGPGTRWTTFREHPFGEYAFPALCGRIAELTR